MELGERAFLHLRPAMRRVAAAFESASLHVPDSLQGDLRSDHAGATGAMRLTAARWPCPKRARSTTRLPWSRPSSTTKTNSRLITSTRCRLQEARLPRPCVGC